MKKTGIESAAEMLNGLDSESQARLLRAIAEKDPELAVKLRDAMFTFDDIASFEDASIRKVIQQVPGNRLALALRGASDKVLFAFFRNMPARAAASLKEDVEALGPQRRSDVDAARAEIVALAKPLKPKTG